MSENLTTASATGRTVTGLALPFGAPGKSSRGTVTVNAGAVSIDRDLKRIKLYRDHSNAGGAPVGYCTAARETDAGIEMSFRIGDTADGDSALADVREGIRDALSVEVMGAEITGSGELVAGQITAVALVAIPAFDDARVSAFTASLHTEPAPETDDDPDESEADDEDSTEIDTPGDNEIDPDTDQEENDMTENTVATDHTEESAPAAAPTGLTATRTREPIVTASAVVDTLIGVRQGRERDDMMTAALADIKRSAHPGVKSSAWLGELWDGVAFTREIVPTMTNKTLTSMRATGWRWTTKPTVNDYKGDKADIPTNTPKTEAVTLEPKRLAGGHDIDRAFFDFDDREFIQSYFAAMTESYAMVSDDRAAAFIVAEAAKNQGDSQPDLLRAAAKARQTIKRGTRTEATTYLVNPDDMFLLMGITTMDNPAYLNLLGVDPARFITNDAVPAGTLIAYAKSAVEWYELGSAPIRVEAEHLAQGGRDAAVFGYYATFAPNPAGIVSIPFAPNPAAPAPGDGS